MKNLVLSCLESRMEKNQSTYARFLLAPFQSGDALTVGTALRRALLSQIEGIAITALEIQGITHEFCTIEGVRESVLELSLNFQQIVLRSQIDLNTAQVGYLQVQGPRTVFANDLKLPLGVECVNPTQHVAQLSRDGLLVVKFLVGRVLPSREFRTNQSALSATHVREAKRALEHAHLEDSQHGTQSAQPSLNLGGAGRGSRVETASREQTRKAFQSKKCFQNIIPLDSFCTPVHRVNFAIQVDNLSSQERERLLFEIWTNGSIHPRQAIQSAVMSLVTLFSEFRTLIHLDSHSVDSRKTFPPQAETELSKRLSFMYKSKYDKMSLLSSDLSNLSLALKTYVFLKQKGVHKVGALLDFSGSTLLQLVNGNKDMFYDIKRCVATLGFQLKENPTESG